MEGIGPLSMNIIDDDITPVRATPASRGAFASCTARGLTVARASVQPPESPPSHWQADYNRVIAHDYQEFMTESIAKRRRLEVVISTHLKRLFCLVFLLKLQIPICWKNSRHQRSRTTRR